MASAMGWMYMVVCFCDMVIFPVAWSVLQAVLHHPVTQWNPLTLQGAGLFHLAMGAVLGIAAWGRTQEKVAGASTVPTSVSSPSPMPSLSPSPVVTPSPIVSAKIPDDVPAVPKGRMKIED